MKNLMEMYIHTLYEEKEAFWDYIELIDNENNKEYRSIWYAIAADELQHYSKLKEIIWGNGEHNSVIESAFFKEIHEEYEEMKKCLEKRK